MKIAFCFPGGTFTKGCFESAIATMTEWVKRPGHEIHLITDYSGDIYNLRNSMAVKALNLDVDYIMWIDSDMVFTARDIDGLIAADVDIVSGVALIEPGRAALAWKEDSTLSFYSPDKKDKGITEVDYCGGAFVLMKADVYKKIPALWYMTRDQVSENGLHKLTSEDMGFCELAKEHGFKIHANLDVKVGHEKRWTLWP